jgi:hypothetical protein
MGNRQSRKLPSTIHSNTTVKPNITIQQQTLKVNQKPIQNSGTQSNEYDILVQNMNTIPLLKVTNIQHQNRPIISNQNGIPFEQVLELIKSKKQQDLKYFNVPRVEIGFNDRSKLKWQ